MAKDSASYVAAVVDTAPPLAPGPRRPPRDRGADAVTAVSGQLARELYTSAWCPTEADDCLDCGRRFERPTDGRGCHGYEHCPDCQLARDQAPWHQRIGAWNSALREHDREAAEGREP